VVIRWGIVGCGDVTERKSGPGLQKADRSELVAVMRRNAALAEDYAARHDVPRWYDDAGQLIDDPDVDAVYVATPPGTHLEIALRVAAAGKPAYVEKPMARTYGECCTMQEAFRQAGQKLFVAYYRRGLPRFLKAGELLENGRLGRITGVSYRQEMAPPSSDSRIRAGWHLQAEQSGGGLFMDVGCHTLDVLDFLLGPLEEVRGTAGNLAGIADVEDCVAMTFRTAGGAMGAAHWNFAGSVAADEILISGTEGRLSLSTFGSEPVGFTSADGEQAMFDLPNPAPIQQPLIQAVVDDLCGRGVCPSTGQSAARTARVMDAVLGDYYGGRGDAFWTRPGTWPGASRQP
jgi:predicted dehydrogenase